ncbi:MAG: homoserine dehydrogenase [Proteobacteria bacterium]|nr:homoserine dehydrogenase [Pseudomonadota bacterium]
MMTDQLKVSLLGFGRVGSNVYRLLTERQVEIEKTTGRSIEITHILVKDQAELEAADAKRSLLTTDITKALDADVVIEMMSDRELAKSYVLQAIASGCDVVTSNRDLIIISGKEILVAAKQAGNAVLFGATVGTATPIIEFVRRHLAIVGVDEIVGTFTGSANYFLTEMGQKLLRFKDVLPAYVHLSQPDFTGWDSASKIALTSAAAFGLYPRAADIPTEGIQDVKLSDIAYAIELGYRLRLLGLARQDGERLFVAVFPALVPEDSLLTRTEKEGISMMARGPAFGEISLWGPGSGGPPTACAVVADIVNLASGFKGATLGLDTMPRAKLVPIEEQRFAFYARLRLEETAVERLLSRLHESQISTTINNSSDSFYLT